MSPNFTSVLPTPGTLIKPSYRLCGPCSLTAGLLLLTTIPRHVRATQGDLPGSRDNPSTLITLAASPSLRGMAIGLCRPIILLQTTLPPQIWKGAYYIQDAVKIQNYSSALTGANDKAKSIPTYPVTLLWYPRIRKDSDRLSLSSWRWAVAEESLLPARGSSPGFQRYPSISDAGSKEIARPPEPPNPAAKGKGKEKER